MFCVEMGKWCTQIFLKCFMQRSEFMELKVNVYLDLKWQNFPNGTSYIQEIGVKSLFLVGIK